MPDRTDYLYWLARARDSHRKAQKLLADPDTRLGMPRARDAARDYLRSALWKSKPTIPESLVEGNSLLELAEHMAEQNPAFQISKNIPAPDGRIFTVTEALTLFEQLEPQTNAETVLTLLARIARELDLASKPSASILSARGPFPQMPCRLAAKRNRKPTGERKSNTGVLGGLRPCPRNRYRPGGGLPDSPRQ